MRVENYLSAPKRLLLLLYLESAKWVIVPRVYICSLSGRQKEENRKVWVFTGLMKYLTEKRSTCYISHVTDDEGKDNRPLGDIRGFIPCHRKYTIRILKSRCRFNGFSCNLSIIRRAYVALIVLSLYFPWHGLK